MAYGLGIIAGIAEVVEHRVADVVGAPHMDGHGLFAPQPPGQCKIVFAVKGREAELLQQRGAAVAEIRLVLPVAVVVDAALPGDGIGDEGKGARLHTHGAPLGQQPATDTPRLEVGVGVGHTRHLPVGGTLHSDAEGVFELERSPVAMERVQVGHHRRLGMMPLQGGVEGVLEHLVAQSAEYLYNLLLSLHRCCTFL